MRTLPMLALPLLLAACAHEQSMYVPTDAKIQECEAQGGSIEPAFALNEYVCLLPAKPEPAAPAPSRPPG